MQLIHGQERIGNNLTRFKKRVILCIRWYKQLRQEGIRMYGEDQSAMPLYDRYNAWNCFWWALHNSGTHLLNGEYRYPTNWQELKAQGKKYDRFDL
jgi:hypothetical protein